MTPPDTVDILIVDDLAEKLLVYRSILDDLGQNIVTAHCGTEALRHVLNRDFAVILLDVNMPDLDGFETARLIRARRRSAHTPIIFVTAQLDDLRPVEAYAHGAVDYIMAPVVPEILRAKVKVFVELFRMHEQVKRQAEQNIALTEERAKREVAEEANRRKDEFLAMLAHELRNPLAPICNAVQLMRHMVPPEPSLKRIQDIIERQLGNLTRLVDDLLDVSRVTSGKVRLKLEPLAAGDVVASALETSRPLIDSRGQKLMLMLPAAPIRLEGDRTRLAQVLSNLLNNAAKYTQEGGNIWLSVQREQDEALFRVRDNGPGIPAQILPRVFDLFTQADQSLDRSQGGLGIGLTLVKTLVEMHQGSVHVTSGKPGEGTEFIVRLPALPDEQRHEPPCPDIPVSPPASKRRILIVDDNIDAAESLALLMRVDGHEVQTANDGIAALKLFDEFAPQIVLLDIGLPRMDGYEIARLIRERREGNGLVLAALTGYGCEEDRSRSKEAGFDHHLVKPVAVAAIRELLS